MSNLAFIIGVSLARNIMQYSRKEEVQTHITLIIIGLSLFYYFFKSEFFLPYGHYENYNQVNFEYLKPPFILQNLYNLSKIYILLLIST